ncbi:MAG: acyl-CoA dehydrogenase family protein, partial [Rubricoccaceae bacterium]|nr:acyl-CoA dehydrogenase family protein [Rubricoccaceae bacterium]
MSATLRPVLREFTPVKRARQGLAEFSDFLDRYKTRLQEVFHARTTADELNLQRGLPPFVLNHIREEDPLLVYVPREYGGRGLKLSECLSMLEVTGYESLPLCLTMGINGGLFLQPLAKYGSEEIKGDVFDKFIRTRKMGGLMITEPDHGSDALNMQTAYMPTGKGSYHIKGTKHWGGLTGWADYWLVTARPRTTDGALRRDIDFFVCDVNADGQHIQVEEYFHNLGLRMIPYGRNRIDVEVPEEARLLPESTGIKMMLDLLNRSRLQFPGMAM